MTNNKALELLLTHPIAILLVRTTQSIDFFQGGEKANSLPEHAKLIINHRVAIKSSFEEVEQHFSGHVVKVAKKYDLEVEAFGNHVLKGDSKKRKFIIRCTIRLLQH